MPVVLALAVLVALAVDRWWGEPPTRWHPVVWMGAYLGRSGAWVQRLAVQDPAQRDLKAFWLGALVWIAGEAMVLIANWWPQDRLLAPPRGGPPPGPGRPAQHPPAPSLPAPPARTGGGAPRPSPAAGRERLRWLVSRDVAALSETQVRESAIETLAENLNDSVVAPLFWFVLLGLPGAALFRFANTADAMWGYPGLYPNDGSGANWAWAGKWAARADDVLGWLPARITALLLALVAGGLSLARFRSEAAPTPSPNSGWPMAAMALALSVRLGKPGGYVLHADGRSALAQDTDRALFYASKAVLALVVIAQAALVLIAIVGSA